MKIPLAYPAAFILAATLDLCVAHAATDDDPHIFKQRTDWRAVCEKWGTTQVNGGCVIASPQGCVVITAPSPTPATIAAALKACAKK